MTGTPKIKWLEKVTVVNTGSKSAPGVKSTTLSFNAGAAAEKLVIAVSSERGFDGTDVVTYNGVPMTFVPGTRSGRFSGFWYLDNPYVGGAATLSVDFSSSTTVNGIGLAVMSLAGTSVGYGAVAITDPGKTVSIDTSYPNSGTMVGFAANQGAAPGVDAPLTSIYSSGDIGSATAAAGYELVASAGTRNYSFTTSNTNQVTGAVVFPPRWRQAA